MNEHVKHGETRLSLRWTGARTRSEVRRPVTQTTAVPLWIYVAQFETLTGFLTRSLSIFLYSDDF